MPTIVGRCGIYRLKNNQNNIGILTTIGWLVGWLLRKHSIINLGIDS